MHRGGYKSSRLREWLALLLMAVAAIAAGRTQANDAYAQAPHAIVQR